MVACHLSPLVLIATIVANRAMEVKKGLTIVGGHDIAIEQVPFMAFIEISTYNYILIEQYRCTGSLIDERYVLTAAHCFDKPYIAKTTVTLGTERPQDYSGQRFAVEKRLCHENYSTKFGNDICLLKLAVPVKYGLKIESVDLNGENPGLSVGAMVDIMGWGFRHTNEQQEVKSLQQVSLPIMSDRRCSLHYQVSFKTDLPDSIFCAGEEGRGICSGDSGGPVMYRGQQIGVSTGTFGNCEYGTDVFTKVYKYITWIQDTISNN